VLAAFNSGAKAPHGETPPGWTLISQDNVQGNINQPVLTSAS